MVFPVEWLWMKLDRTKVMVVDVHGGGESSDRVYWLDKTPEARLRAIETDRQVAYGRASTSRRLQRVLEVAQR